MKDFDYPAIRLVDTSGKLKKYKYDGNLDDINDIVDFIHEYREDKLTPYLKSEVLKKDKGPLKKLVGKNFS